MQFTDRQYTTQKKTLNYLRQELLFHKYSYEMNANESFKNLLPIDFLYGSWNQLWDEETKWKS